MDWLMDVDGKTDWRRWIEDAVPCIYFGKTIGMNMAHDL